MIEDILEYNNEDGVKESKHKHPTLTMVQKQMKGFDESLILYVYHKMNGREQEAQTYLEEWNEEQEELHKVFLKKNELNSQLSITEDGNGDIQHTTPDTIMHTEEQGIHPVA